MFVTSRRRKDNDKQGRNISCCGSLVDPQTFNKDGIPMNIPVAGTAFAAALLTSMALTAMAALAHNRDTSPIVVGRADRFDRDHDRFGHQGWRDERRVAPFRGVDRDHWRSGHWRHQRHHGRSGWWWVIDDDWFFFGGPVHPYPAYIYPGYDVGPAAPPAPTETYWYCAHPQGYYPQVLTCEVQWQPIPSTPPQ